VLELWADARRYHESQPFGGGVLSDWPAIAVEGFAVCREEERAIDDYLHHLDERSREVPHG
jgi:hypothetical protein